MIIKLNPVTYKPTGKPFHLGISGALIISLRAVLSSYWGPQSPVHCQSEILYDLLLRILTINHQNVSCVLIIRYVEDLHTERNSSLGPGPWPSNMSTCRLAACARLSKEVFCFAIIIHSLANDDN